MVSLLINLLVFILILGLVYWVITLIPLPPPFHTVALVILAIVAVIALISMLQGGVAIPALDLD